MTRELAMLVRGVFEPVQLVVNQSLIDSICLGLSSLEELHFSATETGLDTFRQNFVMHCHAGWGGVFASFVTEERDDAGKGSLLFPDGFRDLVHQFGRNK